MFDLPCGLAGWWVSVICTLDGHEEHSVYCIVIENVGGDVKLHVVQLMFRGVDLIGSNEVPDRLCSLAATFTAPY